MASSVQASSDGISIRRLMVGVAIVVMVAFSSSGGLFVEPELVGETLSEEDRSAVFSSGGSGLGALQLLPYLVVYAIGMASILYYVYIRRGEGVKPLMLWILASSTFAVPSLIDVIKGYNVNITFSLVPLALFLPLILRSSDLDWFVVLIRRVCLAYLSATVFYTLLWFEYATRTCGGCVFWPVRLNGFSEHANSLSVIPIIFFAVDLVRAKGWTVLRVGQWLLAFGVLMFSQSKTPMLAALIAAGVVWAFLARGQYRAIAISAIGLMSVAVTFVWVVVIPAAGGGKLYESANTLTGRPRIWAYVVGTIQDNPLGYGSGYLQASDPTGAGLYASTGLIFNSAHNQLLGTLGQGGILGAVGLLAYLALLGVTIVRSRVPERMGALFLYVVLVVWCVTEQLLMATIVTERFFMHLSLFGLVVLLAKSAPDDRAMQYSPASQQTRETVQS